MSLSNYTKTADATKEKHVPHISVGNCDGCNGIIVTIKVGKETLHPSTVEHAIKTIALYGLADGEKVEQLAVTQLGDENSIPCVVVHIKAGKYKKLIATSYCNLHGLWENELEL